MIHALCRPGLAATPTVLEFLQNNWYLVLAAITSGALLMWPMVKGASASGVVPNEAVRLINREKAVLIDVSEVEEYAAGHAIGARNIPFAQLDGGKETAKGLPSNKTLPLVLICPNGARATRAVAVLKKAGYDNAQALAGGLRAWREANLPVEKSAA